VILNKARLGRGQNLQIQAEAQATNTRPRPRPIFRIKAETANKSVCIVRDNVRNTAKKVKSHEVLDFEKT